MPKKVTSLLDPPTKDGFIAFGKHPDYPHPVSAWGRTGAEALRNLWSVSGFWAEQVHTARVSLPTDQDDTYRSIGEAVEAENQLDSTRQHVRELAAAYRGAVARINKDPKLSDYGRESMLRAERASTLKAARLAYQNSRAYGAEHSEVAPLFQPLRDAGFSMRRIRPRYNSKP